MPSPPMKNVKRHPAIVKKTSVKHLQYLMSLSKQWTAIFTYVMEVRVLKPHGVTALPTVKGYCTDCNVKYVKVPVHP